MTNDWMAMEDRIGELEALLQKAENRASKFHKKAEENAQETNALRVGICKALWLKVDGVYPADTKIIEFVSQLKTQAEDDSVLLGDAVKEVYRQDKLLIRLTRACQSLHRRWKNLDDVLKKLRKMVDKGNAAAPGIIDVLLDAISDALQRKHLPLKTRQNLLVAMSEAKRRRAGIGENL